MKVLVLFNGSYPHGMARANRLHLNAKGLVEQGVEIQILVARPGNDKSQGIQFYEGLRYQNIKKTSPNSSNPFIRRFAIWLDKIKVWFFALKRSGQYDLIWPIGWSWDTIGYLKILSLRRKHKIIIEVNEYPYIGEKTSRLSLPLIRNFNRFMTFRYAYTWVDGFIVISDGLKDLVNRYKRIEAPIVKVPILISSQHNGSISQLEIHRFDDPFMFHAGSLNEQKDGIIGVFEAFARANQQLGHNLKFLLTNKTTVPATIKKIEKIIQDNELTNLVVFLNHISNEEVQAYMKKCALAVLNKPDNQQNRHNFSTKLGEYLKFNIPVITTSIGECSNYLRDNENVFIVQPDDVDSIAEKICYIVSNPLRAIEIAKQGRIMANREFDYQIYAPRISGFLHEVMEGKK